MYIYYQGHSHFDTQLSKNMDILKVSGSNYALNVDPIFELFFEISYEKAGTLNGDRVVPKIE